MLKIRLRNGEKMVVNGAVLRAASATTLWLESDAAILRGREVMRPEEANTPARRLYFACMMAYIDAEGRPAHQQQLVGLLGDLMNAIESPHAKAACIALAHDLLREQREIVDQLFGVLERVNADLFAGRIVDAQASVLATLEAAPDFRAQSATRRLLAECGGHA